jgi:hypothetical protein
VLQHPGLNLLQSAIYLVIDRAVTDDANRSSPLDLVSLPRSLAGDDTYPGSAQLGCALAPAN